MDQVVLPLSISRIRLCNDTEVYLFTDQLTEALQPYEVTQTYEITSHDQTIDVLIQDVAVTITAEQLLTMLFVDVEDDRSIVISGYVPCGEIQCTQICGTCTNAETNAQNEAIEYLIRENENFNIEDVSDDDALYRICLCGGRSLWVLSGELYVFYNTPYEILETIAIDYPTLPDIVADCPDVSLDISVDISHPSCSVPTSGDIFISVSGSLSDLITQYSIDGGSSFIPSPYIGGVVEGTYSIVVSSADGSITQTLEETVVLINDCTEICDDGIDNDGDGYIDCGDGDCVPGPAAVSTSDPPDCSDLSSGTITVTVSGDATDVEYSIDGATWQESDVFEDLFPATYEVSVRRKSTLCISEITTFVKIEVPECVYCEVLDQIIVDVTDVNRIDLSFVDKDNGETIEEAEIRIEEAISLSPDQFETIASDFRAIKYELTEDYGHPVPLQTTMYTSFERHPGRVIEWESAHHLEIPITSDVKMARSYLLKGRTYYEKEACINIPPNDGCPFTIEALACRTRIEDGSPVAVSIVVVGGQAPYDITIYDIGPTLGPVYHNEGVMEDHIIVAMPIEGAVLIYIEDAAGCVNSKVLEYTVPEPLALTLTEGCCVDLADMIQELACIELSDEVCFFVEKDGRQSQSTIVCADGSDGSIRVLISDQTQILLDIPVEINVVSTEDFVVGLNLYTPEICQEGIGNLEVTLPDGYDPSDFIICVEGQCAESGSTTINGLLERVELLTIRTKDGCYVDYQVQKEICDNGKDDDGDGYGDCDAVICLVDKFKDLTKLNSCEGNYDQDIVACILLNQMSFLGLNISANEATLLCELNFKGTITRGILVRLISLIQESGSRLAFDLFVKMIKLFSLTARHEAERLLEDMVQSNSISKIQMGLLVEFLTGLGPESREFYDGHPAVESLKESNLVCLALRKWHTEYYRFVNGERDMPPEFYSVEFPDIGLEQTGGIPLPVIDWNNTGPLREFFADGSYTFSQFVGSGRFDYNYDSESMVLTVDLSDTKTVHSLFLHLINDRHSRSQSPIMGETFQSYRMTFTLDEIVQLIEECE